MKSLLIAASTLALAVAAPAWGQTQNAAGAPPAPAPGAQETPSTPPDAAAPDSNGIGDIIVTASRRAESLQKTAIPITAITAEALANRGVQNVYEITRLVPAVKIGQIAGSGTQVTVRGIGNFGGNSFAEPGVPFNVDGVYLARSAGPAGIFYDVDRVEVLKGPQGTLYGRNSTGGVVNIITRDPGKEWSFDFNGEYGNVNRVRAEAGLTIPIADWLSVRIAGQRTISDGFEPGTGGLEDNYAGRVKVKITPTDALSMLFEADYTNIRDGVLLGGFPVPGYDRYASISCGPTSLQNTAIPKAPAGFPNPAGLRILPLIQCDAFNANHSRGLQGTVNYDLGPVAATVIVANRKNTANYLHYGAGFPVIENNTASPSQYTTVEARLASSQPGRLKWVVGGFYYDDDLHSPLTFDQGVSYTRPDIHVYTKSYAGFAEGTFSLTDRLRVTVGGRYTSDHKTITGFATGPIGPPIFPLGTLIPNQAAAAAMCPTAVPGVTYTPGPAFGPLSPYPYFGGSCTTPIAGDRTFKKFTYKGGVEFDLSPTSLLYATYSTGFKSGGFYASLDTTAIASVPANQKQGNSYQPETLSAVTLGSKNRFLDNTLQLNLEGFYWRYKNKQFSHLGIIQPGSTANLVVDNAGAAEVYGAELDALWQPSRHDNFSVDVSYLHSTYTNFAYTAFFTGPRPVTNCAVGPITAGAQFSSAVIDCSGRPVSFSPQFTVNLAYSHSFDLGGKGLVTVGAGTQFSTYFYAGEEYLADERQGATTVSNAELSWQDPSRKVKLTGFVKNLENAAVLNSVFVYPFTGGVRQGYNFPRTYGIRATLHF